MPNIRKLPNGFLEDSEKQLCAGHCWHHIHEWFFCCNCGNTKGMVE